MVVSLDEAGLSRLEVIGQRAFFDTRLSEPAGQSCASCHDPAKGFSGNLGSGLGVAPGAVSGVFGTRNVPSAMYLANAPAFQLRAIDGRHEGGLFWDGRANTLAEQAGKPFFNPLEMNNADSASLMAKVATSDYAELMRQEFGATVFNDAEQALSGLTAALAAFESTVTFQPFTSKYDDVLRGTATFTAAEARGMNVFFDPARGNCSACHAADRNNPDPRASLFTDFSYRALGVPRNPRIPANADAAYYDLGLCGPARSDLASSATLCGSFRVPSLRNVARREAFMHNGFFSRLQDVLAFYATRDLDPARWYPGGVKFNDLPPAYRGNVERNIAPYDLRPGQGPRLRREDEADLLAFLMTLNDRGI
jgi:cytochrome c peroxidase